jgi:hypothetical protein
MIQKARLVQLAEMDLSVVMLDGQLANDAQEMATELLNYQWRDAKVELPDAVSIYDIVNRGRLECGLFNGERWLEPICAGSNIFSEIFPDYWKHQIPLPPLPE